MNRLDKMGYRSVNSPHCQWITLAALSTALSSTFGLIWTEKAPAFVKVHRSIQVWRMIPRQDLTGQHWHKWACGAVELSVFECPESVFRSALIINSEFDMV